jgi:hypothetical protein
LLTYKLKSLFYKKIVAFLKKEVLIIDHFDKNDYKN